MPRTESDLLFEEEQAKLADFLRGKIQTIPRRREASSWDLDSVTDEDMRAWHRARLMLKADSLLEAAQLAVGVMSSISTEDFARGGDRVARDGLRAAIEDILENQPELIPYDQDKVRDSILDSIRRNSAEL